MKSTLITIAITAFASLMGFAQEEPKPEPAELVKLRVAWQRSVSQVTAPLNDRYCGALVKMKTDFTRAGNLEDALAVDAEIKAVEALEGPLRTLNEVFGTWRITYIRGRTYGREVCKDGTWKDLPQDTKPVPGKMWKVDGDRIVFLFPDGGSDWFIMPIDPKRTKGHTCHGYDFTAVRENK
jgi:hypothetical protein